MASPAPAPDDRRAGTDQATGLSEPWLCRLVELVYPTRSVPVRVLDAVEKPLKSKEDNTMRSLSPGGYYLATLGAIILIQWGSAWSLRDELAQAHRDVEIAHQLQQEVIRQSKAQEAAVVEQSTVIRSLSDAIQQQAHQIQTEFDHVTAYLQRYLLVSAPEAAARLAILETLDVLTERTELVATMQRELNAVRQVIEEHLEK